MNKMHDYFSFYVSYEFLNMQKDSLAIIKRKSMN